jgi:arginyl-tRNA synthetase
VTGVESILRERFSRAIGLAFGSEFADDPVLKTGDPKFADYQCNAAMALGRKLSLPPRQVAEQIIHHLNISDLCEPPQIAGPGFINLRLHSTWLSGRLVELSGDPAALARGGVDPEKQTQTVVVDYAGPNVAKEMHVGHLRSSIIGDAIARTLGFLGHRVIRQNHIGDFGTQFGMLIRHARDLNFTTSVVPQISDLDAYYKQAAQRDKQDSQFALEARQAVVALQSGDPEAQRTWLWIRNQSARHAREIFDLLGIALTDADQRGESFYAARLPELVERLKAALEFGGEGPEAGLTQESNNPQSPEAQEQIKEAAEPQVIRRPFAAFSAGAFCIFLPGYVDKDKKPLPLLVQKSDGGFLYAATDLAALYFRIVENKLVPEDQAPLQEDWHAERVIYTTDARQAQHFAMVFDAIRAAHWDINPISEKPVQLEFAPFGTILGEDSRPFKTRSGESVKLRELLDEAIVRAAKVVIQKNPELSEAQRQIVAHAVGIGAVKYADLRQDRTTDYQFAWDRLLALEGNTGPYLQYAFARIQSILRKAAAETGGGKSAVALLLETKQERELALRLVQFGDIVEVVARDLKPHHLCTYLYDLSSAFSGFYESCPVLKAPTPELRASRLTLCTLTAAILRVGLKELLGIPVLEEM